MANYVETVTSKMDWAMPFQRTDAFPLDRSSIFTSLADAQKYAAANPENPDNRGLYGSSYIGQVIAVSADNAVEVYKIMPDRTLQVVGAVTGADGKSLILDGTTMKMYGFDAALVGQQPRIKNYGTEAEPDLRIEWFTPSADPDALNARIGAIEDAVGVHDGAADDPATGILADKADNYGTYTRSEIDAKLASAMHYKGSYATFAALIEAIEGGLEVAEGDVYNIAAAGGTDGKGTAIKAGDNVAAYKEGNVFKWDVLAGTTDLSAYYTRTETDDLLDDKVDKVSGKSLIDDTEITRLGTLEAISDPTAGDGAITLTDKQGSTRVVQVYTLPIATANDLGGVKSSSQKDEIAVDSASGVMSINKVSGSKVEGSVPSAEKVDNSLTIDYEGAAGKTNKVYDGSAAVVLTAADMPLPVASGSVLGGVKSDSGRNNVTVASTGVMTVNDIDASKVKGTVEDSDALGGVDATDILVAGAGDALTAKVKNADKADKLNTAIDFELTGDATGSATAQDLSTDVSIAVTLANSGVTAGEYTKVTVDAKGRVTAGDTLVEADIPNIHLAKIIDENDKQNKAIFASVTFAVVDFVANTDTSVDATYMASTAAAVTGLDAAKDYGCTLSVDGQSIAAALSARFVPLNKVNAGILTVYSNAVPSAPVTVNGIFTQKQ